ncbi:TKL protein kinase [Saprolegnia parasitica CBS 223.65]|uniref:TKL protein kinase n=1 Tax=Saprolegnia parasitica (strain CBS 223.65) TaxID=695850 RepID=A0A067BRT5_SAPPC|nr:TKL protein kinase [Saprolegnia parasitica CBS 223.65]KDO20978.1 TKL protein kinase [Saprolegnia parasitica CBS 223.65]|eukprot:XP_012208291.1 TKL protein kinase [Saprolegnia parasitica CBS 223.65]
MAPPTGLEAQLWDAIQRGNTADAIELLAQGVDPESRNPLHAWTPLHVVARQGNVALTDILLALGANVDALDQKAYSPLQYAVYVKTPGRLAVAHRLLLANASIDVPGQAGQELLSLTERDPDKAMFELLLAHTAVRDATPDDKERAQAALRTWLETHNIPTTRNDDDMAMLLQRAAVYGCARVFDRLSNAGADVTTCLSDGLDLLAIAVLHGHDQLARKLYDRMYPSVASIAATGVCIEDHDLGCGSNYSVRKGVYKDAPVAIKQPPHASQRNLKMLREDIKLQTTIQSPYMLPLLATVDLEPNNPMMVTEFMDQGTLYDYLAKKRRDETSRPSRSENVFLSSKHGIKLSGLECAQTVDHALTCWACPMHYRWMAPEVFPTVGYIEDEVVYETPADIYSFGVELTELDTGDIPYANFDAHHPDEILKRVSAGTLRPSMGPDCAPWLRELADRCLAFDPAERPTASDIVAILAPHLNDHPAP